jgi:hypothetical protein
MVPVAEAHEATGDRTQLVAHPFADQAQGQSGLEQEAFAPLLFGYVSSLFGGPHASFGSGVGTGGRGGMVSPAVGTGLEYTFIIMLAPLLASGGLLLFNRRSYLRDVATADESENTDFSHEYADHDHAEGGP